MQVFIEFARKFFEIAKRDLERARRALQEGDYPEAVFHAQQCVEKCCKALLELKGVYTYDHGPQIINLLVNLYSSELQEDKLRLLLEALSFLYGYYTFSRYPKLVGHRVVSPLEEIGRDIAEKALDLAQRVLTVCEDILRQKGVI